MIGQRLGAYKVVRLLGMGSMGCVFLAVHEQLGRKAAIKVLMPQFTGRLDVARRFLDEARVANLVRHPGLVDVHEFGRRPDGLLYIVMEYLEGQTLGERLRQRGALGYAALPIFRQIAAAMALVHRQGIIHRDLKPANVMLVPDRELSERAKVLDFGIAKLRPELRQGRDALGTARHVVMGTPTYMAPEQFQCSAAVCDRSDVYSLGVMLFEALAGAPPFVVSPEPNSLLVQHLTHPPPLHRLDRATSQELVQLLGAMLEKSAANRPSMATVESELDGQLFGDTEQVQRIAAHILSEDEPWEQVLDTAHHPAGEGAAAGEGGAVVQALPRQAAPRKGRVASALRSSSLISCLALFQLSVVPSQDPAPAAPQLSGQVCRAEPLACPADRPVPVTFAGLALARPPAPPAASPSPPTVMARRPPPRRPIVSRSPRDDARSLGGRAGVAFEAQRWAESAALLRRAVALAPREAVYKVLLAQSVYRLGYYAQVVKLCHEVLAEVPGHLEAELTLRQAEEQLRLRRAARSTASQPGAWAP